MKLTLFHILLSKDMKGLGCHTWGPCDRIHSERCQKSGALQIPCQCLYSCNAEGELCSGWGGEVFWGRKRALCITNVSESDGVSRVRGLQGILTCWGAGSALGQGPETRADFRFQQCCSLVPCYLWLCHHPGGGCTMVPWYPCLCHRPGGGQMSASHHMKPWPCVLLLPRARQILSGKEEQPVLMSTEASCAAMLCQEEEWVPPPPPIHLAAGVGVLPSQAALETFH